MERGIYMDKIKELFSDRKIAVSVLAIIIGIIVVIIVIASCTGKEKKSGTETTDTDGTQATRIVEEEITKEEKAQVETNAEGKISSVVTENGETLNLQEAETETAADGSVTYKMEDGSKVVIDQSGSAKVITTDKESQKGTTVTISAKKEDTTTETSDGTTIATVGSSEKQPTPQSPTQSGNQEPTQASTQASTQEQTQKPTEPQTQPPTQASTQESVQQPTACTHGNTTKKVTTAATATSNGEWSKVCSNCGAVLENGSIPHYSAYTVDIGGGQSDTVYGYFDDAMSTELFNQLNAYRVQNGLTSLSRNYLEETKIRAVECAYYYSHTRPNGTDCEALNGEMVGENIVVVGAEVADFKTSKTGAEFLMSVWKNSPGHNCAMLDDLAVSGNCSVFVKVNFDEYGIATMINSAAYGVQNFGNPEW